MEIPILRQFGPGEILVEILFLSIDDAVRIHVKADGVFAQRFVGGIDTCTVEGNHCGKAFLRGVDGHGQITGNRNVSDAVNLDVPGIEFIFCLGRKGNRFPFCFEGNFCQFRFGVIPEFLEISRFFHAGADLVRIGNCPDRRGYTDFFVFLVILKNFSAFIQNSSFNPEIAGIENCFELVRCTIGGKHEEFLLSILRIEVIPHLQPVRGFAVFHGGNGENDRVAFFVDAVFFVQSQFELIGFDRMTFCGFFRSGGFLNRFRFGLGFRQSAARAERTEQNCRRRAFQQGKFH